MAEGRDRLQWRHTAEVLAMLLNVNKTKGRWLRGADFDPYAAEDGRQTSDAMPINGRTFCWAVGTIASPSVRAPCCHTMFSLHSNRRRRNCEASHL